MLEDYFEKTGLNFKCGKWIVSNRNDNNDKNDNNDNNDNGIIGSSNKNRNDNTNEDKSDNNNNDKYNNSDNINNNRNDYDDVSGNNKYNLKTYFSNKKSNNSAKNVVKRKPNAPLIRQALNLNGYFNCLAQLLHFFLFSNKPLFIFYYQFKN